MRRLLTRFWTCSGLIPQWLRGRKWFCNALLNFTFHRFPTLGVVNTLKRVFDVIFPSFELLFGGIEHIFKSNLPIFMQVYNVFFLFQCRFRLTLDLNHFRNRIFLFFLLWKLRNKSVHPFVNFAQLWFLPKLCINILRFLRCPQNFALLFLLSQKSLQSLKLIQNFLHLLRGARLAQGGLLRWPVGAALRMRAQNLRNLSWSRFLCNAVVFEVVEELAGFDGFACLDVEAAFFESLAGGLEALRGGVFYVNLLLAAEN